MGKRGLAVVLALLVSVILLGFLIGSLRPAGSDAKASDGPERTSTTTDQPSRTDSDAATEAMRQGIGSMDSSSSLEVHVVDDQGSTVPGAMLQVLSDSGTRVTSLATDGNGSAEVLAGAGSILVTTASGFAVSILDLPRASPTPVVIRLQREGAISGVVVDTTGAPAGADVFVLAIPAGSPLNDGEVALRALRGDRRQRLTATDHDGRFRLDQLEPSIKYSLACGGSGRLQMRPVQGIRPNQGDVEIVAGWGYGEIICLVDDHGDPLSDELIHSPSRKFEVGCLDSSILPVHSGSATSLLACPEIEFANGQAGCRVYLFAAPVALANVGPNFYSGTLSGCDPVNAQFLAGPITSPLERTKIVFRCAPEEHGSIAVSFTIDGRPAPRTDGEEFPGGLLVLEPKSGPAIRCPVSEGDLGKQIVRGIPFGLYQARFVAQRSSFTFPSGEKPPLSLRVDKQVAQFDIALDATGGVDIEVRDEHGAAVSGPIAIDFGGPPTIYLEKTTISDVEVPPGTRVVPNSTMRRFAAAPYGVSGISAGKHFVMLREPFRADASGVDNSTIVVEAGKRTRVLFTPKPK